MNNDLIRRGLAISYATSGCVRIIDGEDWIRISEVKKSLNDVPTSQTIKPIAQVNFDKEQLQEIVDKAKEEVIKEVSASIKIPQGEWEESHIFSCGKILRMGLNVIEHKCKNCGRWSIKWERTIPDNFCSYCGADMRKEDTK